MGSFNLSHAAFRRHTRSYSTQPPPSSSSSTKKWLLIVPVMAVVGGAVLMSGQDEPDDKFDTGKMYASKTTSNIAFNWLILKLCSYDFIVNNGPRLLKWAEDNHMSTIAYWVMKKTFFKHFVAGETIEETTVPTDKLKKNGMGVVLDLSIEAGSGSTEELDEVARGIVSTVNVAARDPPPAFAVLKVSGLTSFSLLLRLSDIVTYNNNSPTPLPMSKVDKTQNATYLPRVLPPHPTGSPPPPLTPAELRELADLEARLDVICGESFKNKVNILFDAEQTYYQPAIDYLAIRYSHKYNTTVPVVYNTYQMYLKDGPSRLQTDVDNAKKQGYKLGIKLVRGAYMHSERERAQEMKYEDPITSSINETHANYYKGLEIAFSNLQDIGILIASHNEDTVTKTIDRLRELNVDAKKAPVQFAQLYGMGDHLSFLLLQNGFHVYKYVPFGPIEHVIPYLVRRMQENRGFIGSASDKERKLLWKELMRRLVGKSKPNDAVVTSRGTL